LPLLLFVWETFQIFPTPVYLSQEFILVSPVTIARLSPFFASDSGAATAPVSDQTYQICALAPFPKHSSPNSFSVPKFYGPAASRSAIPVRPLPPILFSFSICTPANFFFSMYGRPPPELFQLAPCDFACPTLFPFRCFVDGTSISNFSSLPRILFGFFSLAYFHTLNMSLHSGAHCAFPPLFPLNLILTPRIPSVPVQSAFTTYGDTALQVCSTSRYETGPSPPVRNKPRYTLSLPLRPPVAFFPLPFLAPIQPAIWWHSEAHSSRLILRRSPAVAGILSQTFNPGIFFCCTFLSTKTVGFNPRHSAVPGRCLYVPRHSLPYPSFFVYDRPPGRRRTRSRKISPPLFLTIGGARNDPVD